MSYPMFVFAQSGVVDVVVGVYRLLVSWCVLVIVRAL